MFTYSDHDSTLQRKLIIKYFIPDTDAYSEIESELFLILLKIDKQQRLSAEDKKWIQDIGMFALSRFADKLDKTGELDFSILRNNFNSQQTKSNSNKRSACQFSWNKYDINSIKEAHILKMAKILKKLEEDQRLPQSDILWLSKYNYFHGFRKIKQKFHMNEAIFYHKSFNKKKDPWQAINASSHYRKAKASQKALDLLSKIDISKHRHKRLRSAFNTTKGGCMRDLGRFADAIKLAEEAHSFDPDSFHPCTLLGALHYDIGEYTLGDEWFEKAVARGAKTNSVDQEIRSIFMRLNKVEQEKLKQHLLNIDPDRYSWVQNFKPRKKKK